ncbi:hypothetical protein [Verrucomicrobium spinosum]|uniref:hypothetical protein n=1 Tax=Verrucomicrobium spinosum TaxID=2736 RepID=UPI000B2922AB|nr:hypothetical protein [Verrucomicrobium spinosum]
MSDGDTLGAAVTTKAFTLQGISTGSNVFSGSLMENNGIVRLNKDGAGIWSVTGVSYYTGATTVTRGTWHSIRSGTLGLARARWGLQRLPLIRRSCSAVQRILPGFVISAVPMQPPIVL